MTEYATREAAIEAMLQLIKEDESLSIIKHLRNGWRVEFYNERESETILYLPPRVIPPDLTTVWVRDYENDGWFLEHSKGKLDGDGWLLCYDGYSWGYWTTEEPEGWRG